MAHRAGSDVGRTASVTIFLTATQHRGPVRATRRVAAEAARGVSRPASAPREPVDGNAVEAARDRAAREPSSPYRFEAEMGHLPPRHWGRHRDALHVGAQVARRLPAPNPDGAPGALARALPAAVLPQRALPDGREAARAPDRAFITKRRQVYCSEACTAAQRAREYRGRRGQKAARRRAAPRRRSP